jgi:hypothetical protein
MYRGAFPEPPAAIARALAVPGRGSISRPYRLFACAGRMHRSGTLVAEE